MQCFATSDVFKSEIVAVVPQKENLLWWSRASSSLPIYKRAISDLESAVTLYTITTFTRRRSRTVTFSAFQVWCSDITNIWPGVRFEEIGGSGSLILSWSVCWEILSKSSVCSRFVSCTFYGLPLLTIASLLLASHKQDNAVQICPRTRATQPLSHTRVCQCPGRQAHGYFCYCIH